MRMYGVIALGLLGLALAAGCTSTVKNTERRTLSSEEARELRLKEMHEAQRRAAEKEAEDPALARDPIGALEAKIEEDPRNPRWYFALGWLHEERGQLELAELRYRAGGGLIDPDRYTGPHLFLGRVLVKQGKLPEGLKELTRATRIRPTTQQGYYLNEHYREAWFLMGTALFQKQSLESAEAAFKRYIQYGGDPNLTAPYFPKLLAQ